MILEDHEISVKQLLKPINMFETYYQISIEIQDFQDLYYLLEFPSLLFFLPSLLLSLQNLERKRFERIS